MDDKLRKEGNQSSNNLVFLRLQFNKVLANFLQPNLHTHTNIHTSNIFPVLQVIGSVIKGLTQDHISIKMADLEIKPTF